MQKLKNFIPATPHVHCVHQAPLYFHRELSVGKENSLTPTQSHFGWVKKLNAVTIVRLTWFDDRFEF